MLDAMIHFASGGVDQTPETIRGIRILTTILPGIVYIVCAVFTVLYPLSKKKMNDISAAIHKSTT